MAYFLTQTFSCGCVETYGPVERMQPDEPLAYDSSQVCPSGVGEPCRACAVNGRCPTQRARSTMPAALEVLAEPIGPRRRRGGMIGGASVTRLRH